MLIALRSQRVQNMPRAQRNAAAGIHRDKSRLEFHGVTTRGFAWLITRPGERRETEEGLKRDLYLPIAIWERKGFSQFKILTMKLDILDEFTDGLIAFRFQPAVDMVDLNKKPVTRDVSRWYMRVISFDTFFITSIKNISVIVQEEFQTTNERIRKIFLQNSDVYNSWNL